MSGRRPDTWQSGNVISPEELIVSQTSEVDGSKLQYLAAGHVPL